MRVIETVATAIEKDPAELPPLQETISADALDMLFQEGGQPPGAYTVFPYSGVWVLVHSDGTIDIFDEFKATSRDDVLPDEKPEPSTDDAIVILDTGDERHAFHGEDLREVHDIVDGADGCSDAWEETLEYATER